ncbi:MAG: nucleotidyltransferase [Candidatus Omnitrophica bacterium]|nr:nucleotidyltransferase [Candidatus Omnitrophota bacterium]
MERRSIFHLVSKISRQAGVNCVLIGGFAVNYYKVTRQTADVDFMITEEDYRKIEALIKEAEYKEDQSHGNFIRLKSTGSKFFMDVDFMFVDKNTLDKILDNGKKMTIAGQEFTVPSLNDLIALKLHALKYNAKLRETKDLPDIIDLIRINNIEYKSKDFHDLCFKYGNAETYEKIMKTLE